MFANLGLGFTGLLIHFIYFSFLEPIYLEGVLGWLIFADYYQNRVKPRTFSAGMDSEGCVSSPLTP